MRHTTTLLGRGVLILALVAVAACATPPKPDPDHPEAATVRGWVTTGTFQ